MNLFDSLIPFLLAVIMVLAFIGLIYALLMEAKDKEFIESCQPTEYYSYDGDRKYPVYKCKGE